MPPKQEITKEKVLAAALQVIREEGLHAVTARNLAKRLKCSTQPVYSAFAGMEELKSAAYDRALLYSLEQIRGYRDDRYPPPLCLAIGYLRLAHDERALFRSVYLSGFSAQKARNNLMIGEEMIASHVPNSSRLRSTGITVLRRIYSKISIYIAGMGAMVNTGAIDFSIEQAAGHVTDLYETILAGETARPLPEAREEQPALGAKIGSGANADVYEFGEGKVVKLFRDPNQLHNLYAERRNHLFIQQAGLPVPKVYEPVEIGGLPGLVYEHIQGQTVAERLFAVDGFSDVKLLAELLHRIHSVPLQGLDWRHMPRVKGSLAWQIDHGKGLSAFEKTKIQQALQQLPDTECLCHGDLNPLNVIIRDDGPSIIDWQGASIGSPAYDVMQLILMWKYTVVPETLAPEEFIREFNRRREEMNRTFVDEYVRLSGGEEAAIDAWFVPVAAAKLATDLCDEERETLLRVIRQRLG